MDRIERITQAYPQAPWRGQLQILGLFLVIVVLAALVAGFYLNVSARTAAVGRDIQGMQYEIEVIDEENENLRAEIGHHKSTKTLEKRAEELGFSKIDPDQTSFLVVPGYPGRQPAVLAPSYEEPVIRAPVLPDEYTESLFVWLYRQVFKYLLPMLEVQP